MRAMLTPLANDGPRFHSDMTVSELTPPVVETVDGVTHKTRPTPTEPNRARGLEPPDPNSGIRPTEVQRLAHEGLEAASHQT